MAPSKSIWRSRHWNIGSPKRRIRGITLQWYHWGLAISFPNYGHFGWHVGPFEYDSYARLEYE